MRNAERRKRWCSRFGEVGAWPRLSVIDDDDDWGADIASRYTAAGYTGSNRERRRRRGLYRAAKGPDHLRHIMKEKEVLDPIMTLVVVNPGGKTIAGPARKGGQSRFLPQQPRWGAMEALAKPFTPRQPAMVGMNRRRAPPPVERAPNDADPP